MKTLLALLAAVVATAGLSYAAGPKTLTIQMKAENHSGEHGTATLTQLTNGLKIEVTIKGAPTGDQPTHIHAGTCAHLNPAPESPLSPLSSGHSVTILSGKKISDYTSGQFSINVHKSANDLKTYVSCGVIK